MTDIFDPYQRWLSIPPKYQPPNHYRLLGLALFEDDHETIASAADRQMAYVRTFQTGPYSVQSQKILNELASAKLCLLDAERKKEYDARLQAESDADSLSDLRTEEAASFPQEFDSGPAAGLRTTTRASTISRSGSKRTAPSSRRSSRKFVVRLVMVVGGGVSGLLLGALIMFVAGIGPFRPERISPSSDRSVAENVAGGNTQSTGRQPTISAQSDGDGKSVYNIPDVSKGDQGNSSEVEARLAQAKTAIAEKKLEAANSYLKQYLAATDIQNRIEAARLLSEVETILSDTGMIEAILDELNRLPAQEARAIVSGRQSLRFSTPPIRHPQLLEMFLQRVPLLAPKAFAQYRLEHPIEENSTQGTDPGETNPFQEVNPFQEIESDDDASSDEVNPFQ